MTTVQAEPMSDVRILTEPSIYLLGKQVMPEGELDRFLADHGVSWQSDSEVAAEVVTETAGRVCFDDRTEVLTDGGWKRFADLDRTERVLTLNPKTLAAEWQRPVAYQRYEFAGRLKAADGADVSLAVTPEHRQFGSFRRIEGRAALEFVPTAEIGGRAFSVLSAARGWRGEYQDAVTVAHGPSASLPPSFEGGSISSSPPFQGGAGGGDWSDSTPPGPPLERGGGDSDGGTATLVRTAVRVSGPAKLRALARLLAHYAADGTPADLKGSGRGIAVGSEHLAEVGGLCGDLGLTWNVVTDREAGTRRVMIRGGVAWMKFVLRSAGRTADAKRLPRWVLDLPAEELIAVWAALSRADANGRETLVTASASLAGQVQELLCKIGAASVVRTVEDDGAGAAFAVVRKPGKPIRLNDDAPLVDRPYRGKVYCATTPNGVLFVRRDGLPHFSGNCYMSFAKPRPGGNSAYLHHIKEVGHGSVLEHAVWSFLITGVSRSLTHELVRHRAGFAYSQLSQRYVDESVAEYVEPDVIARDPELHALWLDAVTHTHAAYVKLAERLNAKLADPAAGAAAMLTPDADRTTRRKTARQAARSVLPNATETKITVTANARALRHFLEQRGSAFAEPEIRKLANALLDLLVKESPNLFADYEKVPLPDGTFALRTAFPKV